jgi:putative transcriptional regulator
MANYHPNDEFLMQFSAGQLPNALGILIACHLEKCQSCRNKIRVFEQIGGELLQDAVTEQVTEGTLEKLMARLDTAEPITKPVVADARIPKPLQRFLPTYYDQLPWSGMTRSIKEFELPISDQQLTAKFYKIAAGKELPEHTHRGNEFTLVMAGSFADNAGEYRQGDFILADTHTIHQPKASNDCDCICFAVMDAPLKMTGFFGRLLNPFLR